MILARIFTVLCAVLLVAAFILAALGPPALSLGEALLMLDAHCLTTLHRVVVTDLSEPVWRQAVVPVLLRPVWLMPTMLGIVAGGIAMSCNLPHPPRKTSRRL